MSWNEKIALSRIRDLIKDAPELEVREFHEYLSDRQNLVKSSLNENKVLTPPLFELSESEAIIVDTVQIYVSIVNYDEFRLDTDSETEDSHKRALRFLHLYYSLADYLVDNSVTRRIDFHGSRVHVVALEQDNKQLDEHSGIHQVSKITIAQALDFVWKFTKLAQVANTELLESELDVKLRVGIDVGRCVAINNGTTLNEKEPLFLGSSANYAAKLAEGSEPGIYASKNVWKTLGIYSPDKIDEFGQIFDNQLDEVTGRYDSKGEFTTGIVNGESIVRDLLGSFSAHQDKIEIPELTKPIFNFDYMPPPLRNLNYSKLKPSNSVRMQLVSMYADLSGYTKFIDKCISDGTIDKAVKALFVIRKEFQNVVEEDFGGRKVRFIGDCIHALIAEGSNSESDETKSVSTAALCASGLFSSFKLCKLELEYIEILGLAIGIELGITPVTCIGIQGKRSVRVASSVATTCSELMQRECDENGIRFGPNAKEKASNSLCELISSNKFKYGAEYILVATSLSAFPKPAVSKNVGKNSNSDTIFDKRKNFADSTII